MFLTHTIKRQNRTSDDWFTGFFTLFLSKNSKSVSANISRLISRFEFPVVLAEFPETGNKLDIYSSRFDLRELLKMKRA